MDVKGCSLIGASDVVKFCMEAFIIIAIVVWIPLQCAILSAGAKRRQTYYRLEKALAKKDSEQWAKAYINIEMTHTKCDQKMNTLLLKQNHADQVTLNAQVPDQYDQPTSQDSNSLPSQEC